MAFNILKKLTAIDKDFYSVADLEKIFKLKRKSLLVALSRLETKGEIRRLAKGLYQLPEKPISIEKITTQIYQPAYISFETALATYGILSQIPYSITLATTNKPKKIIVAEKEIIYRRLKKELFFGFSLENGIYLANPEKALLDQLYLVSKGKATIPLEELDLKELNKKRFLDYARAYPKNTQKLLRKILSSGIFKKQ